jgi:hypothetical protein
VVEQFEKREQAKISKNEKNYKTVLLLLNKGSII